MSKVEQEGGKFCKNRGKLNAHLHGKPRLCYPKTPDGGIA